MGISFPSLEQKKNISNIDFIFLWSENMEKHINIKNTPLCQCNNETSNTKRTVTHWYFET